VRKKIEAKSWSMAVMRLRRIIKTGLLLMLLGVCLFGGWMLWLVTRVRYPIDLPVSMSVGHIRTPEFRVNLEALYLIEIGAETKNIPSDTLFCLLGYKVEPRYQAMCANTPSVVKGSWTLRSDGKVIASGSTEDESGNGEGGAVTDRGIARVIGTFASEKNRPYVLDVDVLADGSQLAPGNPHLKVEAFPEDTVTSYWGPRIFTAAIALELAGVAMLAISLFKRRRVLKGGTAVVPPVA
jgi:hypothetical protein